MIPRSIVSFNDTLAISQKELSTIDLEGLRKAGIYHELFEYYLLGTYPPLKAMDPITEDEVFGQATGNYNLYIHIPFCEQYCTFCHFTKQINPKNDQTIRYLEALHREIELIYQKLEGNINAHTIYFGGGTPSYLLPSQIEELLKHMWRRIKISENTEITFELHPGVIRNADYEDRIKVLKDFGINRWVFGVQSMDEKVLKKLNRGHTQKEVYDLLNLLMQNNCTNISLDLIYGLPYQTLENWYTTLIALIEADVDKFNIFPLMFKLSDPITLHYIKEPHIFPNATTRLLMFFMTEHILSSYGFSRGPIFYYSKKGTHSRQQESKFENIEDINLLSFGVSGFGYVGQTHYFNICDIREYINAVSLNKLPVWRGYMLSLNERMRRTIMFALKSKGVFRLDFINRYGIDPIDKFLQEFNLLQKFNIVNIDDYIKLTKTGALYADGVASIFVSNEVKQRVRSTNKTIINPRKDLLEIHDFSPIGRLSEPPKNLFSTT